MIDSPPQMTPRSTLNYQGGRPLRTLAALFRPQSKNLLLSWVFGAIKQSPMYFAPIITGAIITIISNPGPNSLRQLAGYAIVLSLLLIQNIPIEYLRERYLTRSVRSVEASLRSALVRRLQQLSISFHDTFESGRLHAKILRDADTVVLMTHHLMREVAMAAIVLVVAVSVTAATNSIVALFFVVAVPLAVLLIRAFRGRVQETNRQHRRNVESMSALVSEIVSLVPLTRAHALENTEVQRMDTQVKNVQEKGMRLDMINALFRACAWVTLQTAQFSCLLFTGYLALKGRATTGDVVMYQAFFSQVVWGVNMLLSVYPQIASGFESIRSMGEILECRDLEYNEGKRPVACVQGELQFEDVSLVYPGATVPAVQGYSYHIRAGECIAFVGESGSGKTSIMNLVMGFRRPSEGRILLDGHDMADLDLRTFRQHLAVVPQETILFSGTLGQNITYGLDHVSDERLADILNRANLTDVVAKLPDGLDTMIGENGTRLSGGQRQRVAIARALIRDPRVIILDEATSALDVASEREVQKAIDELIKDRTTLIVAHRLSTIRNADRIVVLDDGRVAETGTRTELLERQGMFFQYATLQDVAS